MIFMKQVSVDDVKLKVAFENGSKNNKKGVKCPESVTPQLPHIYNFFFRKYAADSVVYMPATGIIFGQQLA